MNADEAQTYGPAADRMTVATGLPLPTGTPVLDATTYPRITHAGLGTWHTLCERCGERLTGTGVGGAVSAHAMHITRQHNREGTR